MIRKITAKIPGVAINAFIDNAKGSVFENLSRDELEKVRDKLADSIMLALTDLPYSKVPLSRVRVK